MITCHSRQTETTVGWDPISPTNCKQWFTWGPWSAAKLVRSLHNKTLAYTHTSWGTPKIEAQSAFWFNWCHHHKIDAPQNTKNSTTLCRIVNLISLNEFTFPQLKTVTLGRKCNDYYIYIHIKYRHTSVFFCWMYANLYSQPTVSYHVHLYIVSVHWYQATALFDQIIHIRIRYVRFPITLVCSIGEKPFPRLPPSYELSMSLCVCLCERVCISLRSD